MSNTDHKAPHYAVFSIPCYLVSLTPKHLPQHPILEDPQPMLLPECARPIFKPIQNNRRNYVMLKVRSVESLCNRTGSSQTRWFHPPKMPQVLMLITVPDR